MGLSSKLVPSDGLEFEYWNNSQTPLREQMVGTDQTPRSAAVKRQLPQDPPPNRSEPLKCPRCESTNTKFCYYNNYSKTQPRHFCKACKRHWTKGGTLRNVPVGGSRKNKPLKTAPATSSVSTTTSMAAAAAAAASASTTTTMVVDKHNKPATNDEMFAHLNIGNSILSSPHRDILNSVQFPVSTLSDSMITRVVPAAVCGVRPSSLQAGVAREALASSWSWEGIEPLISIYQGSGWDDSKVQLP